MVKRADKYDWHVGSPPPKIDAHSLVKHEIVRDYLSEYIKVLMSNYRIETLTLSIVDGFAGGGEYLADDGAGYHDGSPLIALKTVAETEAALNVGRVKPRLVDAKYYFVEMLDNNFDYLSKTGRRAAEAGVRRSSGIGDRGHPATCRRRARNLPA
jgi:three-Cys-motif partner protein